MFLNGTPIQEFPADLRVGGLILPPERLRDIQAFMGAQDDSYAVIGPFWSQHQKMEEMHRLDRFPYLKMIPAAMELGTSMHIHELFEDMCEVSFMKPATPA